MIKHHIAMHDEEFSASDAEILQYKFMNCSDLLNELNTFSSSINSSSLNVKGIFLCERKQYSMVLGKKKYYIFV